MTVGCGEDGDAAVEGDAGRPVDQRPRRDLAVRRAVEHVETIRPVDRCRREDDAHDPVSLCRDELLADTAVPVTERRPRTMPTPSHGRSPRSSTTPSPRTSSSESSGHRRVRSRTRSASRLRSRSTNAFRADPGGKSSRARPLRPVRPYPAHRALLQPSSACGAPWRRRLQHRRRFGRTIFRAAGRDEDRPVIQRAARLRVARPGRSEWEPPSSGR